MLPVAVRCLLLLVVVIAAGFDIRFRRIPNALTIPALMLGLLLNTFLFAASGASFSGQGFTLALLAYVPLYLLRGMGAGDVKLMAAVGAIVGPANWIVIFLVTSLLGGAAALAVVIAQGRLYQTLFNLQTLVGSLIHFRAPWRANSSLDVRDTSASRLPHGAVIACGAMLCSLLGLL